MPQVVATFFCCEAVEYGCNGVFQITHRSSSGFAKHAFEFRERQFNRIQIGAVGWQVLNLSANCFDGLAHSSDLVRWQVIENENVSWVKCRCKLLLYIGQEKLAIHRPINKKRSCQSCGPQACGEGHGFPMAVRHMSDQTFPTPSSPKSTGHLGVGPCFVKEYQPSIVNGGTPETPARSAINDVRPLLLSRMQNFF